MIKQYNKHTNVHKYHPNDKVWLQQKTFKTGENEKLSPRRCGPWTIVSVLPNKVNFKIKEDASEKVKVVHHNRLTPVKPTLHERRSDSFFDSDESSSSQSSSEEESEDDENDNHDQPNPPRYPVRVRRQREIPAAIPWDVLDAR